MKQQILMLLILLSIPLSPSRLLVTQAEDLPTPFSYLLTPRHQAFSKSKPTLILDDFFYKSKIKEQMMTLTTSSSAYIPTDFYKTIFAVTKPDDCLVLVNKNFYLQSYHRPDDLILPQVPVWDADENQAFYLRTPAAKQLEAMFDAASKEKFTLMIRSAFRTYAEQVDLYDMYLQKYGQWYVDAYTSLPGHSEHQTGLAFDITSLGVYTGKYQTFEHTPAYNWVKNNAHRYGFVIRYPEGRQESTGFDPEPWHLRYVGEDVATILYQNDWVLEDYLLSMHY